ncbi:hypothetical protein [Antrihabitans sp. YC2-6]|uniref:hypothetical protein n=1 Tax=Antrihabitans sp. YC2-6 TaxID=2799498 RepID=UPI0018F6BE21|nr:hypothetical protein [Antrihabitans sp. YC2-6]MBJ8348711.1 hypothetical protein [Antrihabitans sp. YC2-6]
MNFRTFVPTTALVIACMGVAAGTAQGAPAPEPVQFTTTVLDGSVITVLQGGHFELTSDYRAVTIEDILGNNLGTVPLTVALPDRTVPVAQQILDNSTKLVLTPIADPALRHDVATIEENDDAQRAFDALLYTPEVGIGAAIGGVVGLVAGCIIGLPLAGIGCIPLGAGGAAAGAVTGAAIAGGEPLTLALNDLYETLIGAPWTSKFYNNPNNGLRNNTPIPVIPTP